MSNLGKFGVWAGGFLFGTVGVAILKSEDMKKFYTQVTAAVKRGGSSIMKTATTFSENCADINADANDINEKRAEEREAREVADAKAKIAEFESKHKDDKEEETEK